MALYHRVGWIAVLAKTGTSFPSAPAL